jgi:hypothetical protein
MAIEMLNYADLAARLQVSPEAARALAKRLRLPRSRGNDGKALISVDLAEINHAPLPARSPAGHQAVTFLKAKIETLQAELAKLEAVAGGHRADFEWERDQGQKLKAEFLKMIAVTMTAKEATARLEGELAALKARPWWRRLGRVTSSLNSRAVAEIDRHHRAPQNPHASETLKPVARRGGGVIRPLIGRRAFASRVLAAEVVRVPAGHLQRIVGGLRAYRSGQ